MISGLQAKKAMSISVKDSGEMICVIRISPANSWSSPAYSSVSRSESLPMGKSGPSISSRSSLPSGDVDPTIEIFGAFLSLSGFTSGFHRRRLSRRSCRKRKPSCHLQQFGDRAGRRVNNGKNQEHLLGVAENERN